MRAVGLPLRTQDQISHKEMARRLLLLTSIVVVLLLLVTVIGGSSRSRRRSHPVSDPAFQLDVGKLVIDTDAGSDDGVGILTALGHERRHGGVHVVAITCVSGNTVVDNVVINVLKLLDTANRLDIPVYRGADRSLLTTPKADFYFGQDGFGDFEYPNSPSPEDYLQKEHAAVALIDIVSNNPGEVTVLCIGPLTNVALAIRLDPLFLTKVRQVVVLGGSVEGFGNVLPGIEFNFYTDPEATFIVFNSTDTSIDNIKPIIVFPWESVAKRHLIPMDWRINVLGKLGSPEMVLLNKAEAVLLNDTYWMAGDALVAATVANPSAIVTSTLHEYLIAHVDNQDARGAVFVDYQNSLKRHKNVIIVTEINLDNYKNLLLEDLA